LRKAVLLVVALTVSGCAPLLRNTPQEDAQLVRALVQANLDEIAAGKLAASRAQSRAVRQYAQRVVREHRQLQSEASELRPAGGAGLPAAYDYLEYRKIEKLSGAQFDRAYIDLTTKRHAELLRLLERAQSRAADPALRAFAERALPVLRNRGQSPNS
jgi:putative membrane protein